MIKLIKKYIEYRKRKKKLKAWMQWKKTKIISI